jgi:hypothetical protein
MLLEIACDVAVAFEIELDNGLVRRVFLTCEVVNCDLANFSDGDF